VDGLALEMMTAPLAKVLSGVVNLTSDTTVSEQEVSGGVHLGLAGKLVGSELECAFRMWERGALDAWRLRTWTARQERWRM
jgi:hypothetical protein